MPVAATSKRAYHEIEAEGRITRQEGIILAVMRPGADYSLQELVRLSGVQINAVAGRVNHMKKIGAVVVTAPRKCSITGRTVMPVSLPDGRLFG